MFFSKSSCLEDQTPYNVYIIYIIYIKAIWLYKLLQILGVYQDLLYIFPLQVAEYSCGE